jgi:NAD-dependent deacetylase
VAPPPESPADAPTSDAAGADVSAEQARWTEQARAAFESGDVEGARRSLPDPQCPEGWSMLGALAHVDGDLDTAARCHRRALALEPRYGPAHAALAVVLAQRGETLTARAHLEVALRTDDLGDFAWLRAERQRASIGADGQPIAFERCSAPWIERAPSTRRLRARGSLERCEPSRLRELIASSQRIVALTGAGISRASGLETRKELWQRFVRDDAVSAVCFRKSPHVLWQVVRDFWGDGDHAPNAAHLGLACLPALRCVVTQNVDSLHQRAAATVGRNIETLELHGTLARTLCVACGREHGAAPVLAASHSLPPRCECGGVLRPDVVLFGERTRHLAEAVARVEAADLLLVVGCALDVSPASELPVIAWRAGATVVEIKRRPSGLCAMIPVWHAAGRAEDLLAEEGSSHER